jgi:hypothetical protein
MATNSAPLKAANSMALATAFFDKVEPSVATKMRLYINCSFAVDGRSLTHDSAFVLMHVMFVPDPAVTLSP